MKHLEQAAALPYRRAENGLCSVLLITTRTTHRWIIPKGNVGRHASPAAAAAIEAAEEAGVTGVVSSRSVGTYHYDKIRKDGSVVRLPVRVFPLAVVRESIHWPEEAERERRWAGPDELDLIEDPDLRELVSAFVASSAMAG